MTISKSTFTELKALGFESKNLNGLYTFTHKVAQEGIIVNLSNHNIESFAYIDGERVLGEASSDVIFQGIAILDNEIRPPQEIIEDVPDVPDTAVVVTNSKLTTAILDSRVSAIEVLMQLQTTPVEYIKERKLTKTRTVKYVDGQYMTRALNYAFMFDWSFEVPETRQDGDVFTALGVLTANVDGQKVTKTQWGSQKLNTGMELGDALKGATTDALKKCASLFGIAADVYAGEV